MDNKKHLIQPNYYTTTIVFQNHLVKIINKQKGNMKDCCARLISFYYSKDRNNNIMLMSLASCSDS